MKKIVAGALGLLFGATTAAGAGEDYAATQAAFLAANAKKAGWGSTSSGLQFHAIKKAAATAKQAMPESTVTVNYEGKLTNGKIFDSSFERKEPISFPLGAVIQGWQEGVPMMKVGEMWEFAIPSEIGYGPRGAPPDIPGGAVLLFRIELLDVKP